MSKASFEIINYSIRPGKAVERKMISSLLSKLSIIHPIEDYQYIGFGSTYFHDFILFHKELGISKLISIEAEEDLKDRFIFNKPFKCIDLEMGLSTAVLPTLSWNDRTILWLDYDTTMNSGVMSDISTFCTNCQSGNLIMLTLNCQGNSYGKTNEDRKGFLIEEIGEDNVPYTLEMIDFSFAKISTTLRTIIDTKIRSSIRQINNGFSEENQLTYYPLINFKYKDGATMITVGGIVLNQSDHIKFERIKYTDLDFYRPGQEFFTIKVPSITQREMRFINSQLPSGIDQHGNFTDEEKVNSHKPMIPAGDVKNYAKIYRFLPMFNENYSF